MAQRWIAPSARSASVKIEAVPTALVAAAQYVRMSDDLQRFSIENQKAAIWEYALKHGFEIIKTYADPGKSGVAIKNRPGLRELLKDVVRGNTPYKAILVYDVSRWGRFANSDEAAHYEFLCSSAGIPLHYCAEQFANDGTATSSLLKALKRSMAAEFSRELGEKVFRGKTRLVQMGYWVGGQPGFGFRRMMVSGDGTRQRMLASGERKSLTTDRIILVPGPQGEIECVRRMFSLAIKGLGATEIARELNRTGMAKTNKPWSERTVALILRNPKYAGWNVWNQGTARLQATRRLLKRGDWITRPQSFTGLVNQETFDKVQATLPTRADAQWSDSEILTKLRRLLAIKGRLGDALIRHTPWMPGISTIRKHFGSAKKAYVAVGYHAVEVDCPTSENHELTRRIRRRLVADLTRRFPDHVSVTHLPNRTRSVLLINGKFFVSILFCPRRRRHNGFVWVVKPHPAEREFVTLLCRTLTDRHHLAPYYLFRDLNSFRSHDTMENDPWLRAGTRLASLNDFYKVSTQVWASGASR